MEVPDVPTMPCSVLRSLAWIAPKAVCSVRTGSAAAARPGLDGVEGVVVVGVVVDGVVEVGADWAATPPPEVPPPPHPATAMMIKSAARKEVNVNERRHLRDMVLIPPVFVVGAAPPYAAGPPTRLSGKFNGREGKPAPLTGRRAPPGAASGCRIRVSRRAGERWAGCGRL